MRLAGQYRIVSRNNPWPAGDGIGIIRVGKTLYKIGGWYPPTIPSPHTSNRVDMSVDNARTWFRTNDAPFSGRHTFPTVELNGKIYVVGGDMNSGVYHKGLWEATPHEWGLRWRKVIDVASPLAQGRAGHLCWAYEGRIVLAFGQTVDQFIPDPANKANKVDGPYYDDMWSWTPGDPDFVKLADNMGIAPFCFMAGSPVRDGYMWGFGGGAYDTAGLPRVYRNMAIRGTLSGFEVVTTDAGFAPCMYNAVAIHGDEFVTAFGVNGDNMPGIFASETGENFRLVRNDLISARHAVSLVSISGELMTFGGPLDETTVWGIS